MSSTTSVQQKTRTQEIRAIHHQYRSFYRVGGVVTLLIIGIWLGYLIFGGEDTYGSNVFTEVLSVVITVLVMDRVNEWRDSERLKKRLVREAGSKSNEIAKVAVDWLRYDGWLSGEKGLLQGANLAGANLEGVDLQHANLREVQLRSANLRDAYLGNVDLSSAQLKTVDLRGAHLPYATLKYANLGTASMQESDLRVANLEEAHLRYANLNGANLRSAVLKEAHLQGANLSGAQLRDTDMRLSHLSDASLENAVLTNANLEGAHLGFSNLRGANLQGVNLSNAHLEYAQFSETTVLPDGTKWVAESDLSRFTDPGHSDFWHNANPQSSLQTEGMN